MLTISINHDVIIARLSHIQIQLKSLLTQVEFETQQLLQHERKGSFWRTANNAKIKTVKKLTNAHNALINYAHLSRDSFINYHTAEKVYDIYDDLTGVIKNECLFVTELKLKLANTADCILCYFDSDLNMNCVPLGWPYFQGAGTDFDYYKVNNIKGCFDK